MKMMMRYFPTLLLAACLVVFSCNKESEDAPILKGSVGGHVGIKDCYGYALDDLSGVQVRISSDIFSADTITDVDGNFLFENVPFGKYNLSCTKENFLQQSPGYTFGHVGGEIATTISENLLGIPDFGLLVDSLQQSSCLLGFYVKIIEASKATKATVYWAVMYFNDSPDVDTVNFGTSYADIVILPSQSEGYMSVRLCESDVFSTFSTDSIYCRMYLAPFCYSSENAVFSLPRSKPSNVFGFKRLYP
jgi:hypothetical protein